MKSASMVLFLFACICGYSAPAGTTRSVEEFVSYYTSLLDAEASSKGDRKSNHWYSIRFRADGLRRQTTFLDAIWRVARRAERENRPAKVEEYRIQSLEQLRELLKELADFSEDKALFGLGADETTHQKLVQKIRDEVRAYQHMLERKEFPREEPKQ